MSEGRDLDLVLFGASGFVGRLTATYLAGAAPPELRIGLAGRSRERLAATREGLGPAAADWPLLVADLDEPTSLAPVAAAARVVATTAGPYAEKGLSLVAACIRAGTDYCDLSGEVLFIRESIERHHAEASAGGVRIVHACGVDSIPSDLGVLLLAETARAAGAAGLEETIALVKAFRGGVSGGTIATMREQLQAIRTDPHRRRIVEDPYALSPDRSSEPDLGAQPTLQRVARDRELGVWLAPFVMAGINSRIVRRSNALRGWAYGRGFRYREALAFPGGAGGALKAAAAAAGLRLLAAALTSTRAQPLVERLLPAPGEGPGEQRRRTGAFAMEIRSTTTDQRRFVARIAADGDPGYSTSSLMLGESALCLALDHEQLPPGAGILTPGAAMGDVLVERLRAAGLTFIASGEGG